MFLNFYEWNSTVGILLCLASFTRHSAYEMYVYSGSAFVAQCFLVFYCMTIAQFIYLGMTKSAAKKFFSTRIFVGHLRGAYGHSFLLGPDEYLNLGLLSPALAGEANLHPTSRGVFSLLHMLDDTWYCQLFLC